jgi:hypothetical protein
MPFISPNFQDTLYQAKSTPKPEPIRKPMANPKTLSPVLIASMIRNAATKGSGVTRSSLLSLVNSNTILSYGDHGAAYEKEKPGVYIVSYFLEGQVMDTVQATNTHEAKSLVIEHLVEQAEKDIAQEKSNV